MWREARKVFSSATFARLIHAIACENEIISTPAGAVQRCIIEKETNLPEQDRWPDYHSLPAPTDTDGDGLPDFWETQFGLNPRDASDGARIATGGYANIEHYFNNTSPKADPKPLVFISATVSRADAKQPGEWRVTRRGDLNAPLMVLYKATGEATAGTDYTALPGTVTIPAGKASVTFQLTSAKSGSDKTVVVTLDTTRQDYHVGCPSASLVVIRKSQP